MKHAELKKEALKKDEVKTVYDALEPEFSLLRQILKKRREAGLSQAEVARRMGTKAPSVTRLESSLSSGKYSPSLGTLKKYAKVLGCRLEIKLVTNK